MSECKVCGDPLDLILAQDTHPCCDPGDGNMTAAAAAITVAFGDAVAGVSPPEERPAPSLEELLGGWSKPNPYWRQLITGRCPDCGRLTPCGLVGHDGTVHREEPTRCLNCSQDAIEAAVRTESILLGYPLMEQGPCVRCRKPCHRYGSQGHSSCPGCTVDAVVVK